MINGAHVVVTSTNPEADHSLLRDVFKLPHVNDGGYLIFGLPPAEISVHQGDSTSAHQLFFTCASMLQNNAPCSSASSRAMWLCGRSSNQRRGMLRLTASRYSILSRAIA